MNYLKNITFCLSLTIMPLSLMAQSFQLSLNKESGVYRKGERAVVTCRMDSLTGDSLTVRISRNNQLQREERICPQRAMITLFDAAIDSTCAVSLEVSGKGEPEGIGFVVAPEGFRAGYKEPVDLMDYWNNQKALLRALPNIRGSTSATISKSTVLVRLPCGPIWPSQPMPRRVRCRSSSCVVQRV